MSSWLTSWLSFPRWMEIFVVLHMPSNFAFYHGHFEYYTMRFWIFLIEHVEIFVFNQVIHLAQFRPQVPRTWNGKPLQFSCLENPMDVHGVAKCWTRLSDFTFAFTFTCEPPSGQTGTWVVVHLLVLFWKSLVCWCRPDQHVHSLGVHKQLYRVTFMSSSLFKFPNISWFPGALL